MNLRFNIRISIPWLFAGLTALALYHLFVDPVHAWTGKQQSIALYLLGVVSIFPAYSPFTIYEVKALFKLSTYRELYNDLQWLASWISEKAPTRNQIIGFVKQYPGTTGVWVFAVLVWVHIAFALPYLVSLAYSMFVEEPTVFDIFGNEQGDNSE